MDDAERSWAQQIARHLDSDQKKRNFDRLVLIGVPKLLSNVRTALSDATAKTIVAELAQDLVDPSTAELRHRLAGSVRL